MEAKIVKQTESYIRSGVRNKVPLQEVDDVVQEVLLSLVQAGHLRRGQRRAPCKPLVRTILQRRVADLYRARGRRHESSLTDSLLSDVPGPGTTPEVQDQSRSIRNALATLKPRNRRVIEQYYYRYQTHRQIAEATFAPIETIRTRHKRALKALRIALESRVSP